VLRKIQPTPAKLKPAKVLVLIQPPPIGRQIAVLIGILAVCFLEAGIGASITFQSVNGWYRTIQKPAWTPPDWVFSPVWTVLYALMAVAAWLVWRRAGWRAARFPLVLFGLQLVLNVGWSLCFFGFRNPGLAAAEIVVLWLAIAVTTAAFWLHSRAAALLMGPYLAWTSFALVLNVAIWRLNA
jgi:tryptophan-rich sensory protein